MVVIANIDAYIMFVWIHDFTLLIYVNIQPRASTPLRDMPPAQPLPRSTNDRTSPLGGNSLNNSMEEWSLVGPGNQGNIIPRVVHGTVSKDDSVGSSRSTSTLTPSKVGEWVAYKYPVHGSMEDIALRALL